MVELTEQDFAAIARNRWLTTKLMLKYVGALIGAILIPVGLECLLENLGAVTLWPVYLIPIPFIVWGVWTYRKGLKFEKQFIEECKRDGLAWLNR